MEKLIMEKLTDGQIMEKLTGGQIINGKIDRWTN